MRIEMLNLIPEYCEHLEFHIFGDDFSRIASQYYDWNCLLSEEHFSKNNFFLFQINIKIRK